MEGLELELRLKESMEWGYNYYTEELEQLGYTHQAKGNELEVYDGNGTFVGKSYLEKEGQVSTRRFEAAMEVPEQVEELSNQLLLIKISLGYSERDIALLQQEGLGLLVAEDMKETLIYQSNTDEQKKIIATARKNGTFMKTPLGGKDYIGEVIVSQRPNKTGFYLHEVEIKEKLMEMFKTPTERSIPTSSRLIMARHIDKVKNCKVELSDTFEPTSEAILKAREVLEQNKKISDWLARERVQFPLSLTKSDIDTITLKDNSVKTRTQFEDSMMGKLQLESNLPEKLLTPAQIREGKHQLPVKQDFMEKNHFFPPIELVKEGTVHLHCTTKDLSDSISQKNTPIMLKLTPKQAAVLIDASIKQKFMENRQAKQPKPFNLASKSKMEENFFTGLKNVQPQLTRKDAEKQYHKVYAVIERELKELRRGSVVQKSISRKSSGMEW